MPYPNAHWYVLAIIPVTILGFWPSYFSNVAAGPTAFHVHAFTSTVWTLLLAWQCWSIHNGRRSAHRIAGLSTFLAFPLYMIGFFMVFQTQGIKAMSATSEASETFRAGIGAITIISIIAIGYLYFAGLRSRRNVQLHARCLLAIPFLFAESVLDRVFGNYVPGLIAQDISQIENAYRGFHLSQILAIALAIYLYNGNPRFGKPFIVVSGAMILQSITLETLGDVGVWRSLLYSFANVPVLSAIATGLVTGVVLVWLGWIGTAENPVPRPAT